MSATHGVILGPEAFGFVHDELEKAGSIARMIQGWEKGVVWMPGSTPRNNLTEGLPEGDLDMDDHAAMFIIEYLASDPCHIALFEDQFFKLQDPVNLHEAKVFEHQNTLYHFRDMQDIRTVEEFAASMARASHYPQVVILTSGKAANWLPSRKTVSSEIASDLAESAAHLLLGAFDEEGYVLWSRIDPFAQISHEALDF